MIAIVTSCIHPIQKDGLPKSSVSVADREMQTIKSLTELRKFGFKKIILIDNSISTYDYAKIRCSISDHLQIISFRQYQFKNKGINELLMLLAVLEEIPDDESIFKISGRYYPVTGFSTAFNLSHDFKIRTYNYHHKIGSISTRAYFVKNKIIYKAFLLKVLNELFIYPHRIVGIRSFFSKISAILKPDFNPKLNISIEFAGARILKKDGYKVELVERMGIEGIIAGANKYEFIQE